VVETEEVSQEEGGRRGSFIVSAASMEEEETWRLKVVVEGMGVVLLSVVEEVAWEGLEELIDIEGRDGLFPCCCRDVDGEDGVEEAEAETSAS